MTALERLCAGLSARYRVEREIGRGATATVYLAYDLKHSRTVALKVLNPELSSTVGAERFLREIQTIAQLSHPHILSLYDSGECDGVLYYVIPYVPGESLRAKLSQEKQLPLDDAVNIGSQIAQALDYAHRRGIVHRDVKPENILFPTASHACLADFGLARALFSASNEKLTATGLSVGSPLYMSPEQITGGGSIDGRSDIYSLGCVLYEMVTGRPPFQGATVQAVLTKHLTSEPTPISESQPGVPAHVAAAIAKALAKSPIDRFSDAVELAVALTSPAEGAPRRVASRARHQHTKPAQHSRWRRWGTAVFAVSIFMLGLVVGWKRWSIAHEPVLDDQMFAVMPFIDTGDQRSEVGGRTVQAFFREAMRPWQDIDLVEEILLNDAMERSAVPGSPHLASLISIAKSLGAGRLLVGTYYQRGETLVITASLYALADDPTRPVATRTVELDAELADRERIDAAVTALLHGDARALTPVTGRSPTRIRGALIAMGLGAAAQSEWDLQAATTQYRRASELDPGYAEAWLKLSTIKAWLSQRDSEWRRASAEAARLAEDLAEPQRTLALAGGALAARRYPEACALYQKAEAAAPLSFEARIGLGNCHAWDEVVLPDSTSPSGYRFRSSYEAAFRAYRRAIEIAPSANFALGHRLDSLLYVHSDLLRKGHLADADTPRFRAFPGLDSDTLTFIPHRIEDVLVGAPGVHPRTHAEAVERNRLVLNQLFQEWSRAFPGRAEPLARVSAVLESLGELEPAGAAIGAVSANRLARSLATDSLQSLRLSIDYTRLLLKTGRFDEARELADSLLGAYTDPTPAQAELLSGAAALTGRAAKTADLLQRQASLEKERLAADGLVIPAPVLEAAHRFLAFAALGGPIDSLVNSSQDAVRKLQAFFGPGARAVVRRRILDRQFAISFFELGPGPAHADSLPSWGLIQSQKALSMRDFVAAQRVIAAVDSDLASYRAGDLPAETAFNFARMRLAMGDTAGAVAQLDRSLSNMNMGNPRLLEPVEAAALVRAMRLSAELARARHDQRSAERWASAVNLLWPNADSPLKHLSPPTP